MEKITPKRFVRLSKSCIGEAEKKAVLGVLDREFLGMGTEVQEFEHALTDYFGRPAVCVVNGTAALQLALQAAGIGSGDEVLVQSLTYVASFQAISATGAVPVACDVDLNTLTLDWRDAEKRLTKKTKAVMPVHYAGGVGELDEIYSFATRHGLRVIEDAAHAFASSYKSRPVGGFGDIACFSFDGIKNITSGEGGCVVTDEVEILRKVKDARLLGVEKDTEQRYSGQRSWSFDVTSQGWRYHMSNIMAAIGIEQLKKIDVLSQRRKKYANLYSKGFKGCNKVTCLQQDYVSVVPHIYTIVITQGISRAELRKYLDDRGIQTGIHYQPNHELALYRNTSDAPLLNTADIAERIVTLPLHPDLVEDDVKYVIDSVGEFLSSC